MIKKTSKANTTFKSSICFFYLNIGKDDKMATGIVKWFDNKKGYGFISANGGQDVFLHHSQVKEKGFEKDIHEGQELTFDIVQDKKGLSAVNVQKMS